MTALLIDIAVIALIIAGVKNGMRKGLIKSVWRIAAWILTIILVCAFSKPMVNFLSGTQMSEKVYNSVYMAVSERMDNIKLTSEDGGNDIDKSVSDATGIPSILVGSVFSGINTEEIRDGINNSISGTAEYISQSVSAVIIRIAANIILFLLIRILLSVLFHLLNGASRLPILKGVNSLLGGALGFVNIMLVIYLACALIYLLLSVNTGIYEIINDTYIVKYFYNNNILLHLFIRI